MPESMNSAAAARLPAALTPAERIPRPTKSGGMRPEIPPTELRFDSSASPLRHEARMAFADSRALR